VDNAGNEAEIGRRYFVDTEKAALQVDAPDKTDANSINVSATITDNFDDIRLYVNGSEVYRHDQSEPYGMKGFEETIDDIELDLENGKNAFEFKVVDLGGHVTKQTIEIEQASSIDAMLTLVDQYKSDGEITGSQARLMRMQLTTIGHFHDSGTSDKTVKHMNSFKQMLHHYEENGQIMEDAATELR